MCLHMYTCMAHDTYTCTYIHLIESAHERCQYTFVMYVHTHLKRAWGTYIMCGVSGEEARCSWYTGKHTRTHTQESRENRSWQMCVLRTCPRSLPLILCCLSRHCAALEVVALVQRQRRIKDVTHDEHVALRRLGMSQRHFVQA